MKRAHSPLLIAPLLLLTATACREQPITDQPDLAVSNPDLSAATEDLSATVDSATTADLTAGGPDLSSPAVIPTEFVVVRVGDGTAALTLDATAAFLERRKLSDGSLVGTALALPTAVAGANKRLTMAGSSTSEGALSLSADRKYLVIAGYDANVGTTNVPATASATVNRVIGVISGTNVIDTTTAADFFTATNVRGATSSDGTALWAGGPSGTVYTTRGSTAAPVSLNTANTRCLNIFGGQLYATSSSGANRGVNSIGTGLPKTTAAATLLSGFDTQTTTSHYGFVGFDRDATPGIDVIYVADDRATGATGGGVQRWSLAAGKWKLDGTMAKGLTAGVRGLTGYINGNSVVVLATTAETTQRVVSFVDDGTALDMLDSKELAKAATNTAYRGITFAPQ